MPNTSLALFLVAIMLSGTSLLLIGGKRTSQKNIFLLYVIAIAFWAIGLALFGVVNSEKFVIAIVVFYYISAASIASLFFSFSASYNGIANRLLSIWFPLFCWILLSTFLIFKPDILIKSIEFGGQYRSVSLNLPGYIIYCIFFVFLIVSSYINFYYQFQKSAPTEKLQIKIICYGTIPAYLFGMFFNLILPIYTYEYVWAGPLFAIIVVAIVLYSVYKHHLFQKRAAAAEVFVFLLWFFILLRIFYTENVVEKVITVALLISSIILGILVVRSVRKEIKIREDIEKIAKDLENANSRLKELDQQKSEFVSLASHQLRGPLTAVKGYASMLLDGDFGTIEKPEIKDAIDKIYTSTQSLVVLVADYLDVSRIEQGRMQYDFTNFDMRQLVETVGTELQPNIQRAKLAYKFDYDTHDDYTVNADMGKIKQVIGNIIDNAIKYTPKGGIHVWLTRKDKKLLLTISDTGVGIRSDILPRLFEKFTRAPDASKTNIMGTGLGLYVARKMIEAHHGRIWAESPGAGKGSSFFIELEAVQ